MKIRTDFVTNSSSSNYSVVITIKDKKEFDYNYEENLCTYGFFEDGACCGFGANLGNLLVSNAISNIKRYKDEEYELEYCDRKGRPGRIKKVSIGDLVTLVKVAGQTRLGCENQYNVADFAVDVRSAEGSLGLLPGEALKVIREALESDAIELKVTVRNKIYGRISVSIDAEEKTTGHILVLEDVSKLAQFLVNAVYNEIDEWIETCQSDSDIETEKELSDIKNIITENRKKFVADVSKNIASIKDISKITVDRYHSAWGEFSEAVADNDPELRELAQKVNNSSGDEQETALAEMLTYIRKPSSIMSRFSRFGEDHDDFRYKWNGDRNDLLALAKRLWSGNGADEEEGREHDEIDFTRGIVESYAEYDLK